MNFIKYLEKRNITTGEELWILAGIIYFYLLSQFAFKYNLDWFGLGFSIIIFGGMANLYVIGFNNLTMPVLPRKGENLAELKGLNPDRRVCILNPKTKLKWLADRFYIRKKYYSLGDFIISFGGILLVLPFIIFLVLKII